MLLIVPCLPRLVTGQDLGVLSIAAGEADSLITDKLSIPEAEAKLLVQTDVGNLRFESNRGILSVENIDAGYLVSIIAGTHILTVKAEGYLSTKQRIYAPSGVVTTLTVQKESPALKKEPIGSLDIQTEPIFARVTLAGMKLRDRTPLLIKDMPVGEHEIQVSKENYHTINKTVVIEPDKTISLSFKLELTEEYKQMMKRKEQEMKRKREEELEEAILLSKIGIVVGVLTLIILNNTN